jgi:hypothetical protein
MMTFLDHSIILKTGVIFLDTWRVPICEISKDEEPARGYFTQLGIFLVEHVDIMLISTVNEWRRERILSKH